VNILTITKIHLEAYLAQSNGICLPDLIETKSRLLQSRAPSGGSAFFSVQQDGKVVASEVVGDEGDITDELALRKAMGDKYAELLQQRATHTIENISGREMDIREMTEYVHENKDRQDSLAERTSEYAALKREAFRNLLAFSMLAMGEIWTMFMLFADLTRISSEFAKHFMAIAGTLAFSVGFFFGLLLLAEWVLHARNKVLPILCLFITSILVGKMRVIQAMALQDVSMETTFMSMMYVAISLIFPLAAAVFVNRWKTARHALNATESMMKHLVKQESRCLAALDKAGKERGAAQSQLDDITAEYVTHYQKTLNEIDKRRVEKEAYVRNGEAYLAELRLAYKFWEGWSSRGVNIIKPLTRAIPVAALIAVVIFLLSGCTSGQPDGGSNAVLICDRSSSAGEYASSSETIKRIGRMWAEKADSSGGGEFEVFVTDKGFDTVALMLSETFPNEFPGPVTQHKKTWKEGFVQRLSDKANGMPSDNGSAIAEAIYRASLRVQDKGETTIYVLSDMREVNQVFNFENKVPEAKEFIDWLDANSIKPEFTQSTRLVVCGFHPYSPDDTSRMTAQNYERLMKLWKAVFEHWGIEAEISETCDFGTY
jgi:hypothetical protein